MAVFSTRPPGVHVLQQGKPPLEPDSKASKGRSKLQLTPFRGEVWVAGPRKYVRNVHLLDICSAPAVRPHCICKSSQSFAMHLHGICAAFAVLPRSFMLRTAFAQHLQCLCRIAARPCSVVHVYSHHLVRAKTKPLHILVLYISAGYGPLVGWLVRW